MAAKDKSDKKWGELSKEKHKEIGFIHLTFKTVSQKYVSPLVAKIFTANQVTMLNFLVVSTGAGYCFYYSNIYLYPIIGSILLIIRAFVDRVDGDVASIRNEHSGKGGLLDDLTDRFSIMIIYLGYVWGAYNQYEAPIVLFTGMVGFFGISVNSCLILMDKNRYIKYMSFIKKIFYLPYYLMIPAAIIGNYWPFLIMISILANIRAIVLFVDFFFIERKNKIIDMLV